MQKNNQCRYVIIMFNDIFKSINNFENKMHRRVLKGTQEYVVAAT